MSGGLCATGRISELRAYRLRKLWNNDKPTRIELVVAWLALSHAGSPVSLAVQQGPFLGPAGPLIYEDETAGT